jgi:hypothetical protein
MNSSFSFPISLSAARIYLAKLDFSYLIQSMCAESYFLPRWSLADATSIANIYKNFLYLQKKHCSISLVPTREIDEIWHNHILHTKNYFQDCYAIFGHYYHHHPLNPEEDLKKLITAFKKTKQLYFKEFKSPLDLIRT